MKRKTLSIALAMSVVLVSLMSSGSNAMEQNQIRVVADTGIVALGPDQVLRVIMKDGSNNVTLENYVLRRIDYTQSVCGGGICKDTISSQTTSAPMTLAPNESLRVDLEWNPLLTGTRLIVLSNRQDVAVNSMIIDSITGKVVSIFQACASNEN